MLQTLGSGARLVAVVHGSYVVGNVLAAQVVRRRRFLWLSKVEQGITWIASFSCKCHKVLQYDGSSSYNGLGRRTAGMYAR